MKVTDIIILIASVLSAFGVIYGAIKVVCGKIVEKVLEDLTIRIEAMDTRSCRQRLIDFLHNVESGEEMDEVQVKFAYETYDYYINTLHKNSYVRDKWEKVMGQNLERK